MGCRKKTLLVGTVLLLAMMGLVVAVGLMISIRLVRTTARPDHIAIQTSTRTLATPIAYITLAPTATPAITQPAFQPTATFSPTPTATPVSGNLSAGTVAPSPTPTLIPTNTPADTTVIYPTPTPSPESTDTPTPTPLPTTTDSPPTPTATPSPTATPLPPGRITGRLLLNGTPAGSNVNVRLEDQHYNLIAETTTGTDGVYVFRDLEPSGEGYNVIFAREWNTGYAIDQVVSWGWVGPVAVDDGSVIEVPDFEISLQGFEQINPKPNTVFSAAALSPESPIVFEWTTYPQAMAYWVDLAHGEEQEIIWQSSRVQATFLAFDGKIENGTQIQPGEYWWGVGARRPLGPYMLTIYGYLPVFMIDP